MNDNSFASIFLKISGVAYLILMTDVLLTAFTAPVWLLVFLTPLNQSWLLLAIVAPLLAPAIGAAFVTFDSFVTDGSTAVVRAFVKGWGRLARRTLPIGAAASALGVVIGVDLAAVSGSSWGALTVPVFVTAGVLGVVTLFTSLAIMAVRADVGRLQAMKLGLVFGIRGGLWSLVSLGVLALFGWMVWHSPTLTLIAAPAPVLFVVWFDARRAVAGWLEQGSSLAQRQESAWAR
ncbi:MAG: hypothetical protein FWD63_07400 [Propionibacteriaceae bacterium]|nr:hypothetical protein [Propionibacteriaceae bacterium]